MSIQFYPSDSRGGGNYDWLKTKYSFSFANYYDPERMGFGVLRVINDDWIAAGAGFPTHPHQNMEIVTIPFSGKLAHKDDAGGEGVVEAGMVQVMSAGTGVLHSEFNASKEDSVELFQIWIEPNKYQVQPRYQEAKYSFDDSKTNEVLLVGPEGQSEIWIHQNAFLSRINILPGEQFSYSLKEKKNGVFLMVIAGEGEAESFSLASRDALEITESENIEIKASSKMDILVIEVPV